MLKSMKRRETKMIYGFDTLRSFIVITPYYEYIQHWCSLVRTRQNVFHKYSICNAELNEQFIGFSRVCRFALTYDLMPTQWLRLHNRCTNHIMFSQLYHISLFNIYTEKLFSQVIRGLMIIVKVINVFFETHINILRSSRSYVV